MSSISQPEEESIIYFEHFPTLRNPPAWIGMASPDCKPQPGSDYGVGLRKGYLYLCNFVETVWSAQLTL